MLIATIAYLGPLAATACILAGNMASRIAGVGTGAWYAPRCTSYMLFIIAMAVFGFRNATAGRRLFASAEDKAASAGVG